MEIGTIMMIIGIMGIIAGMVLLFLLPGIFRKQRKKMMEEIGEDLKKFTRLIIYFILFC